jgi:hypothetical protein
MIYRLLADFILIAHVSYVLFAAFGGLLTLRWRWAWKIHLPAVVWGFLVEYFILAFPLTAWENYFRALGGEAGYEGGFIEYYLTAILYPGFAAQFHLFLSISLIVFNLLVYWFVFRRKRLLQ